MKNPMWDAYEEWLEGVYYGKPMSPQQAHQIECAFFAGCAFSGRVRRDHGERVIIDAIQDHIARKKAQLKDTHEKTS